MYPGVAQLGSDGSAAGGGCSDLSEWQQLGDCQASCASADRALVATGSAGVSRTHSRSRSIHTQYNIKSGCGAVNASSKYNFIYPGVAQLVARVVWDHQAAGSIPVTRTISSVHNESQVSNTRFSIYKQILKKRNTTSINQLKRRAVCEMP